MVKDIQGHDAPGNGDGKEVDLALGSARGATTSSVGTHRSVHKGVRERLTVVADDVRSFHGVNMAAGNNCSVKWPPLLKDEERYEVWRSDLLIWCDLCELPKKKQAQAVHLSLPEGSRARDATSEIDRDDLKKETGVEIILEKLDDLFLADKGRRQFSAFKELYNLRRPTNVGVSNFVKDFEHAYFKFKAQDMQLPDSVMAFMLLASSALSDSESQLVMSSLADVTYKAMKSALKKIFDQSIEKAPVIAPVHVKQEEVIAYAGEGDSSVADSTGAGDVYYARAGRPWRGRARGRGRPARGRGGRMPLSGANSERIGGTSGGYRRKNPLDHDGNVSRCVICDSCLHWARDCPHSHERREASGAEEPAGDEAVQLSLFMGLTGDEETKQKLQTLAHDSVGSAILDTGCINTVCGEEWLDKYVDMLNEADKAKITSGASDKSFTFGDGVSVASTQRVTLPCYIGNKKCEITTDVVKCKIPLLLSKNSMKKASMVIDLGNDTVAIAGVKQKLECTSSGHYKISLVR